MTKPIKVRSHLKYAVKFLNNLTCSPKLLPIQHILGNETALN
ncbi:hypothetical protein [Calothrix sp. PCC 7507]|nr:hypothetical protein [Calothrix sp. PCC 7507]